MNGWKQPIPVSVHKNENVDMLSRMLFFEILTLCQNQPFHKVFYHGNKRIDITLSRGQCLFNIAKYERELKIPRSRIEKCLKVLNEWQIEMQIERKPFGAIITVLNYDKIVKMQIEKQNETQIENKSKTNRKQKPI